MLWIDFFTNLFAALGILGNIFILRVLLQRHMQSTFNKLRGALAVFDTLHLVPSLLCSILKSSEDVYGIAFPYILWPMRNFAYTASTFLTVAIAVERYVAIRDPQRYRMNKQYRTRKYVSSVTVAALLLNVAKFFELKKADPNSPSGGLVMNGVKYTCVSENLVYRIYNTVIFSVLTRGVIPITVLMLIYGKIYIKMKGSHLEQDSLRIKSTTIPAKERKKAVRQGMMARTFAGVVLTSFICAIPELLVRTF